MSYSPELSPIDYSEDEKEVAPSSVAPPTIKLKLKLNPYPTASTSTPAAPSEDKKKKKHKKKHKEKHKKKHKKSKHADREESHHYSHHHQEVDQDEEEDDDDTPTIIRPHAQVGGKRPFALLQQQQQQQKHQQYYGDYEEEEQESDTESYHPTDTKKARHEPASYDYDQEPMKQEEHTAHRRPSKQGRRSSSMKSSKEVNGEKPKKRGRPTNKAKAAAIIAALPPKVPETPKKDLKSIFIKLLDNIQKRDAYGFFLEPVNPKLVPDYLKIIKSPMDFSTMRKNIESGSYTDVDQFRHDFNLIITNAKLYNSVETIYWKSADKIHEFGSKLIDRAEKQVEEEKIAAQQAAAAAAASTPTAANDDIEMPFASKRQDSFSARKLSISFSGRKDSFGIKEEDVDIMGIDTNVPSLRKQSRQGSEINTRETSVDLNSSRAITPIRSVTSTPYKKKKKKVADTGVLYAPDGSLHTVGGVNDLTTLLPKDYSFAEPPQLTTSNPAALPSVFFSNRHAADDFFQNKHFVHSAHFYDYGPFTTLGAQPPGAFYTAQDASYIYPLYGDDRGEAYMKSLWDFLDDDDEPEMTAKVEEKSNYLTRGAWQVVKQVLERKNENIDKKEHAEQEESKHYDAIETEFGPVNAADIVDKIEAKREALLPPPAIATTPITTTPIKAESAPLSATQQ